MKTLLSFALILLAGSGMAQFIELAPMNANRCGHTATTLADGNVLVTGGSGDGTTWSSAEIWDANADTWTLIAPMASPRVSHQANALSNGKVLVHGGWDGGDNNLATTALYDSEFDEWENSPDMSVGRSNHRSIALSDGLLLITGGYDGNNDQVSCDIYDPEDNTMYATGDLNMARSSHTLTLLEDGRVLATGGFNPDEGFQLNTCEIYDPGTGTWSEIDPMTDARDNHAAAVYNGQVVVTGGRAFDSALNHFVGISTYEVFDPSDDSWAGPFDMGYAYSYHQVLHFAEDGWLPATLFIPGGTDYSGSSVENTYTESSGYAGGEGSVWYPDGVFEMAGAYRYAATMIDEHTGFVCGGLDDNSATLLTFEIVGVEENTQPSISLYPNPSSGILSISNYTGQFDILDITGKVVSRGKMINSKVLDLSTQAPGVYLFRGLEAGEATLPFVLK